MTAAWSAPVDLDNCASEPIHVPGAIQPHGALLALSEPELVIEVASGNVGHWFGVDAADAIGRPIEAIVGADCRHAIDIARRENWVQRRDAIPVVIADQPMVATLHRSDAMLVLEIEQLVDPGSVATTVAREAAMALQAAPSAIAVADAAARWVRSLTGFDRVMVYRFDEDWNGEVIAEQRRDDLNSFLGLHYPSTDIPAQARELYRRNWLRIIPDVGYTPVALVPEVAYGSVRPLDLSQSTLRSVSPIHIEYLTNMGVSASMSVSIVIRGELWGLIACHHYSGPHRPDVAARNAAEFLAQLISLRIAETQETDMRVETLERFALADAAPDALQASSGDDVNDVLRSRQHAVLGLANATGAVVATRAGWYRLGDVPPDDVIRGIVDSWPPDAPSLRTDRVGDPEHSATAGGALAVPITDDHHEFVMWLRPELVRQVDWGGDPRNAKLAVAEGADVRLSPRRSFDLWRETVRGRSAPWTDSEANATMRFTRRFTNALMRRERDNAAIAASLQQAMRPAELRPVPGWRIDVHDQPADGGQIGGDWFDVFDIGGGIVIAIVGDVAGHGLRAAAEMAQLRNSLRAYVLDDPSPADALCRLDRLVARLLPGTVATVVCAAIHTSTEEIHIAHAGHLPALVVSDGRATFVDVPGDPLLGIGGANATEQVVHLGPGDALVLYSDGLIERRRRPIDDGLEQLQAAAPAAAAQPDGVNVAAWLAARLHDVANEDDTSVLYIRRDPA